MPALHPGASLEPQSPPTPCPVTGRLLPPRTTSGLWGPSTSPLTLDQTMRHFSEETTQFSSTSPILKRIVTSKKLGTISLDEAQCPSGFPVWPFTRLFISFIQPAFPGCLLCVGVIVIHRIRARVSLRCHLKRGVCVCVYRETEGKGRLRWER